MVLDTMVWDGGMGDQIAIFALWCGRSDIDDSYRYAIESAVGGFDGSRDVGHTSVSGDV